MTTVRWTEHGPEPVEEPASAQPANAWDEILSGALERQPDPDAASPAAEPDVAPEPAAGAPSASEPAIAETEAKAAEDPAAVLARLKEKGLLRTEPSVRIRDITGDAPRPAVVFEPEPLIVTGNEPDDALGDPEELEPEQPGPTTTIRCAGCRTKNEVPDSATGYRCTSCDKVWRWAECGSCHDLNVTIARQESWRCKTCGGHTRSWWRTPTKAAEHRRTAEARATQAADRRRKEAYEKARRRRWKLLVVGATAIVATAVGAITVSRHAAPITTRGANGKVCDAFADVQRSINSQAPPAELRASIDALAAESVDAIDRIRIPAQRLAGSGRPGDKPFDDATKALANACAG